MRCLQRAVIMAVVALAVAAGAVAQENGNNGWGGRGFATFNVGAQTGSPAFDYNHVTTLFDQTATAGLNTPGKTDLTFDIGGGVRLVQNLGVGVTFSRYSSQRTATLTTTIPSPLNAYFPSAASTVSKDLPMQREENAIHIQGIYRVPLGARVQVGAFGGPSYFRCVDNQVSKFSLDATFSQIGEWAVSYYDVQQSIDRGSTWGYHGGGSVTFLASRHIGVGLTVRYSNGTHTTTNPLSDTSKLSESGIWGGDTGTLSVKMKHGGIQWNGGVSLHF